MVVLWLNNQLIANIVYTFILAIIRLRLIIFRVRILFIFLNILLIA